jgi:methylenetetrahydrofolate reductase (NADPH)
MSKQDKGIRALLAATDFEIIPFQGAMEKAAAIHPGATVSVTTAPARGTSATIDLALELQERGYRAVPHLSARMIEDRRNLASIIKRLDDGGVAQAFIVGGDGTPHGDYSDAFSLLRDMAEVGHPFLEVGITGYPEGHPAIPAEALRQAMHDKQPYATYIVTQMCFSPTVIADWVRSIRADGVTLPVKVGVPGAVDPARLLTMGARIGVGESIRFLRKNRSLLQMLRPGRYRPGRLIEPLGDVAENLGITGVHLFTFNQVAPSVEWHRRALAKAT